MLRTLVYVATARGGLEAGLSRGDLDLGPTASHRSPCFGTCTIHLWYDIAVFVAVLSFHSARYRSDYGPRRPIEARVISARSRPRGSTAPHRHRSAITPCVALVRYDSGMTSPFSQLCFRSIVHDIAAAMSRQPVCYHTFAKSLRFTRHHTQLPFEMHCACLFSLDSPRAPRARAARATRSSAMTLEMKKRVCRSWLPHALPHSVHTGPYV